MATTRCVYAHVSTFRRSGGKMPDMDTTAEPEEGIARPRLSYTAIAEQLLANRLAQPDLAPDNDKTALSHAFRRLAPVFALDHAAAAGEPPRAIIAVLAAGLVEAIQAGASRILLSPDLPVPLRPFGQTIDVTASVLTHQEAFMFPRYRHSPIFDPGRKRCPVCDQGSIRWRESILNVQSSSPRVRQSRARNRQYPSPIRS